MTAALRRIPPHFLFGAWAVLLAAVAAGAWSVTRAIQAGIHPDLLADALTLDLVVVVPLAYATLLVRGARWPALSILPVFVLSVVAAHAVVGEERGTVLRWVNWVAVPAELLLLTVVARRAQQMARELRGDRSWDALETIQRAARRTIGVERVADAAAYELAVLYYGLLGGSRRAEPARSYRPRGGYGAVLAALLIVLVVESVAVHLFVRQWSVTLAWVLTTLTAYGALWLIGDYRAMRRRPTTLDRDGVTIRFGLRWTVRLPYTAVAGVRRVGGTAGLTRPDHLRATILGSERLILELDRPVVARGAYGIRREVRSIGLAVDAEEEFVRRLERRLAR